MITICTKTDRRWLEEHYGRVLRNDPILCVFRGKMRRILRDRMVEMTIAEKEGKHVPAFPPAGFNFEISRLQLSTQALLGHGEAPDESGDLPLNEQFQIERMDGD